MANPQPAIPPAPASGYGGITQALHWAAAGIVVAAWALGIALDLFPRGDSRSAAMGVHTTLGLLALTLSVLRILWSATRTALPHEGPEWMVPLARAGHVALYVLTVALPLTGLLARWTRSGTASLVGGWSLPAPFPLPATHLWIELHGPIAYALAALVAAHVGAALFHHLVLRDGVLRRMVPVLSR